jgi:hypothetical protein
MKTINATIVLAIAILFISNAKSQSRIGYSFDEVKNEFSSPGYTGQEFGKNADDSGYHFYVTAEFGYIAYFFDKDSICNLVFLIPLNDTMRSYIKAYYNKSMNKVNADEWVHCNDDDRIAVSVNYFTKEKNEQFDYFEFKKSKY